MRRWGVRTTRLLAGLLLYGISLAMMVRANLGLGPWDVLHEGLSRQTGIGMGWIVNITSALVLALWWPLRQRPGVGTIANVILVGLAVNATLTLLPPQQNLAIRIPLLLAGIVLTGVATGLYVGAGLGPGPRDGLMTGLAARGLPIAVARTGIEIAALIGGFIAGGTAGIGTVLFALGIGPLAHYFIPRLTVRVDEPSKQRSGSATGNPESS